MNNNLSFKAKIDFVNKLEFAKRMLDSIEVSPKSDWVIESAKIGHDLHTKKIYSCNAGVIHNADNAFMYHLIPHLGVKNFIGINSRIEQIINNFGSGCTGIITGGDIEQANSLKLFEILKNIHKGLGIKFSHIWGKVGYNNYEHIHYSTKLNKLSICNPSNNLNSPEDIKNHYSHIFILPEDELMINGVEVDRKKYPEFFKRSASNQYLRDLLSLRIFGSDNF